MTSCSPSSVTIFVGLLFMAIHLAMALVIASNLDCSIGFAFSFSSISVGWCWEGLQLADFINWSPALNGCLLSKWYVREDVLRWYLNSHLHMLQTTTEFDLKVNLPPKINLKSLLVAIFFKRETGSLRKQKGSRRDTKQRQTQIFDEIIYKIKNL